MRRSLFVVLPADRRPRRSVAFAFEALTSFHNCSPPYRRIVEAASVGMASARSRDSRRFRNRCADPTEPRCVHVSPALILEVRTRYTARPASPGCHPRCDRASPDRRLEAVAGLVTSGPVGSRRRRRSGFRQPPHVLELRRSMEADRGLVSGLEGTSPVGPSSPHGPIRRTPAAPDCGSVETEANTRPCLSRRRERPGLSLRPPSHSSTADPRVVLAGNSRSGAGPGWRVTGCVPSSSAP